MLLLGDLELCGVREVLLHGALKRACGVGDAIMGILESSRMWQLLLHGALKRALECGRCCYQGVL